ncbi:MAG TPA: DUF5074 domain-containing protein [Flavobacterium sp.]|nr:DUF5074 domain-containing protein [Flavobacterium sp.]
MKKINKLFLLLFALVFSLSSCSTDESANGYTSEGDFENGFFVLNEGNSNLSSASITFVGDDHRVEQDIFRTINPQADQMGTYLQSMFFDATKAYIISGSSNAITVVNRFSFEYVNTIATNLTNPRYGVVSNGKIFVTNLGNYSATGGFVTVIDLSDLSSTKIMLNTTAERILAKNNKIYVSNGSFGSGNTITVIDGLSANLEATVNLGQGKMPISIVQKDDVLYVLTKTEVLKIAMADNAILDSIEIPSNISSPNHLSIDGNNLYFTGNGASVYSFSADATEISSTAVLTHQSSSTSWGAMYGFAVRNGKIYIADVFGAGDSDGKAYVYSASGNLLTEYSVGVIPNGFYFNP